jgi:hypothetical protein
MITNSVQEAQRQMCDFLSSFFALPFYCNLSVTCNEQRVTQTCLMDQWHYLISQDGRLLESSAV